MILCLNTSTGLCQLTLIDGDHRIASEWQADRGLAKGLLSYLQDELAKNDWTWQDLTGLIAYQGPGSFTGLRIGLTVLNTIASSENIPIVGQTGEQWVGQGLDRLMSGQNDKIVLPEYGSEAHITTPRK